MKYMALTKMIYTLFVRKALVRAAKSTETDFDDEILKMVDTALGIK